MVRVRGSEDESRGHLRFILNSGSYRIQESFLRTLRSGFYDIRRYEVSAKTFYFSRGLAYLNLQERLCPSIHNERVRQFENTHLRCCDLVKCMFWGGGCSPLLTRPRRYCKFQYPKLFVFNHPNFHAFNASVFSKKILDVFF